MSLSYNIAQNHGSFECCHLLVEVMSMLTSPCSIPAVDDYIALFLLFIYGVGLRQTRVGPRNCCGMKLYVPNNFYISSKMSDSTMLSVMSLNRKYSKSTANFKESCFSCFILRMLWSCRDLARPGLASLVHLRACV